MLPAIHMDVIFDRGTIVVHLPVDGGRRPSLLTDDFIWDQRVGDWRAPAYRLPSFRARLARQGISFRYLSPRPEGFLPSPLPPATTNPNSTPSKGM